MNKIYYFSLIIFLLLVCESYSQQYAARDPQPGNAVIEQVTGIHCGACPAGHAEADRIAGENPGRVVIINIHAGGYAIPGPGEPDFRTKWGDALMNSAGINAYPGASINRRVFPGNRGQAPYYPQSSGMTALHYGGWEQAVNDSILNGSTSPVNLGIKTQWDKSTRNVEITVDLYFTSNVPGGVKLNVAMLENHVRGRQIGGFPDQDNYEHNHILRDFVTGQWGELLPNSNKDLSLTKKYKYKMDDKWKAENCDIAVYVTQADNYNIFTCISAPVYIQKAALSESGSNVIVQPKDMPFERSYWLRNLSVTPINFNISLQTSARTPSDWTAELSGYSGEVAIPAGDSINIPVKFTPGATIGAGDALLSIIDSDDPDALPITAKVTMISKELEYLEVNAGGTAELAFNQARASSVSLDKIDYKLVSEDLTNLKFILWNTGAKGGITSVEGNLLSKAIDNKIGLLIAGSVSLPLLYYDNPDHVLFSKLGMGWNSDGVISGPSFNLAGIPGDPVSDGFSAYGTSSVNGYELQRLTVTDPEITVPMIMCTEVNKAVSLRMNNGSTRAIALSFNTDAISDQNVLNRLVKKSIDWIENITSIDDTKNPDSSEQIGLSITPNPVSGSSTVVFELNASTSGNITIELFNMLGQRVALIWSGETKPGNHSFDYNFIDYPKGTYFLILRDKQGRQKKIALIIL